MAPQDVWREFTLDPRRPEHAALRASDADRDVTLRALGEAYAEGRIDREELDERTHDAQAARALGELPALLVDLVPSTTPALVTSGATEPEVHTQAVQRFERIRREALSGFLIPTIICWVVWTATMFGGFPWPLFPMLGTGIPLLSVQIRRRDIIASQEAKVRKQLAKDSAKQAAKQAQERHPEPEPERELPPGE